jgi:hypothetical protein
MVKKCRNFERFLHLFISYYVKYITIYSFPSYLMIEKVKLKKMRTGSELK